MKKSEINKRISELKRQIRYEKKKMQVCSCGTSDLQYLQGLENELNDLEELKGE